MNAPATSTKPARILAVCTDGGTGDLLAATPAMRALQRRFGVPLSLLASPRSAPILEGHPAIAEVLTDDGSTSVGVMARSLATREFTHAVIFWSNARVAALAARARIPIRVGQARRLYSWLYTIRVPVRTETGDTTSHWTDVQMDYARALGAEPVPDDYRSTVVFDANDVAQAAEIISRYAPSGRFIVWHAARGMRFESVQWPVHQFAAIGDALGETFDAPILLTGTAGESALIDGIADAMRRPNASIAGQTSLRSLAALCARATCVVALDSGPMHIAAAVGAPTLGIFALRTDLPQRWRPLGLRVAVIGPSFPCPRGCRKETCRTFDCYRALDPVTIAAAARAVAGLDVTPPAATRSKTIVT